jgi:dTMP kinase
MPEQCFEYAGVRPGVLIALEGVDSSGKSTQLGLQVVALRSAMPDERVVGVSDPAGTQWGAWLAANVFNERMFAVSALAELLAFESSRAALYSEVVLPALATGAIVVCDRSPLSSLVYQGHALGLDLTLISALNHAATSGRGVDFTVLLDLPSEVALSRVHEGSGRQSRHTRHFLDAVRYAYLDYSGMDNTIRTVDASLGLDEVSRRAASLILEFLCRARRPFGAAPRTRDRADSETSAARPDHAAEAI